MILDRKWSRQPGLKLLDHRVLKQINAKTDIQKYKQTKKP